jgi:hypothetical protein
MPNFTPLEKICSSPWLVSPSRDLLLSGNNKAEILRAHRVSAAIRSAFVFFYSHCLANSNRADFERDESQLQIALQQCQESSMTMADAIERGDSIEDNVAELLQVIHGWVLEVVEAGVDPDTERKLRHQLVTKLAETCIIDNQVQHSLTLSNF